MRTDIERVKADQLVVGDTICFDHERYDVVIERITESDSGWIGVYANDDSWSSWYLPDNIVWRLRR